MLTPRHACSAGARCYLFASSRELRICVRHVSLRGATIPVFAARTPYRCNFAMLFPPDMLGDARL